MLKSTKICLAICMIALLLSVMAIRHSAVKNPTAYAKSESRSTTEESLPSAGEGTDKPGNSYAKIVVVSAGVDRILNR